MWQSDSRPLALTMGEPAGIGPELALGAWLGNSSGAGAPFFYVGDPGQLREIAGNTGLDVPVREIDHPSEAVAAFATALPCLPVALARTVKPGAPDPANGPAVIAAIERAAKFCLSGAAAAMVTGPIQKHVLYDAGFQFPGHTEFLASLGSRGKSGDLPVMMIACDELRTVPVTIHIPLEAVATALTSRAIVATGRIVAAALEQYFAIAAPRLAVTGLNPHAGEAGALGAQDRDIIAPAVAELRKRGIAASGPHPADTLFHQAARQRYDAALCMYHDQALIPVKTIAFERAVNVTLGLPIIRTSPDHGTALDIAGTGSADPSSLLAALDLAAAMAERAAAHRDTSR